MNNMVCDCPNHIKAKCSCSGCGRKSFNCFHRNSVIMASAGTGKTYSLAMRYLQLLLFGVELKEILAVTFTRKAAGEIFDEIISNLLKLIESETNCHQAGKNKLLAILQKLLTSGDVNISTIDSFFGSLLRTYAPELGITGDITMYSDKDDRPARKVVRQFLRYSSKEEKNELREIIKDANNGEQMNFESIMSEIIKDLYPSYLRSLHDIKGRCVWGAPFDFEHKLENLDSDQRKLLSDKLSDIAAGATDKTVEKRVNALSEYIAFSPFYGNIPEAVKKLFENFHNYNSGDWLYSSTTPVIYTTKFTFSLPDSAVIRKAVRYVLRCQLEKCKKKSEAVFNLIKNFDGVYDREIRTKGMLTFADQPLILRNSDEAGTFHLSSSETMNMEERLDAVINHYLFDEFQDTSHDQWYIFSNLVDEILSTRDDRFRSFFCVGDIKQSIYQWRGGDPYLFEKVISDTREKSADLGYDPKSELFKSFRSSQDILDPVNITFSMKAAAPQTFNKALERMKFTEHVSSRKNFPGFTAVINIADVDSDCLIESQARVISEVLSEISPFNRPDKLTVGVLMQRNDKCEALAEKLKEINGNLPISIDGCLRLQTSMAFSVLRELIKLSEHPADNAAKGLLSMLSGSTGTGFQRITPQDIAKKLGFETTDDFNCDELASLLKKDIFQKGLAGFIQHFLDAFDKEFSEFDYDRVEAARTLAENFSGTPEEFLHAVDTWYELKDQSVESTVQFMTIHKSKGLGFDIVFIPDMSSKPYSSFNSLEAAHPAEIKNGKRWINFFPNAGICRLSPELIAHQELMDEERVFEECCKFYVAMTRAKRAMYIFADAGKQDDKIQYKNIHFQHIMCKKLFADGKHAPAERLNNIIVATEAFSANSIIYASGKEDWFVNHNMIPQAQIPEPEALPVVIRSSTKQRVIASHQDKESFKVNPELRFASRSTSNAGTVLHGLFEDIDYITPDFDVKQFLDDKNIDSEIAELFRRSLADDSELITALAKPDHPHILWRERRFLVKRKNGETVPGAFDRVTISLDQNGKMDHAEILDYKSDNVDSLQELVKRHSLQMKLYRECLSRMTDIPEDKIKIKLAALRLGKIVEIK